MSSNFLSNAWNLVKADLEVNEIPVLINALQVYQKNPNQLGKLAAVQSLVANAPVAALTAEAEVAQEMLAVGNADLQNILANATAEQTAALAKLAAPKT
jgi:hypothetical protein